MKKKLWKDEEKRDSVYRDLAPINSIKPEEESIRALQNPEVKAEYDALQPEYDIIQAMIDARVQQNMTQKDL